MRSLMVSKCTNAFWELYVNDRNVSRSIEMLEESSHWSQMYFFQIQTMEIYVWTKMCKSFIHFLHKKQLMFGVFEALLTYLDSHVHFFNKSVTAEIYLWTLSTWRGFLFTLLENKKYLPNISIFQCLAMRVIYIKFPKCICESFCVCKCEIWVWFMSVDENPLYWSLTFTYNVNAEQDKLWRPERCRGAV